jgi:hypothetical protein
MDASCSRSFPLVCSLGLLLALPALAAEEISTDVTVVLDGTLAADEDVVEDAASAVAKIELGALPAAADVIGYSVATNGDVLFSLDVSARLPGGVDVTPRDVVRWDGSVHSVELRGASHGIPAGAQIDAIGMIEGDLLVSLDVTATLSGVTADDEDLVRLDSTQPTQWSLLFNGSAHGVPAGADLDAADVIDDGAPAASARLALSFDVSGSVGGVAFDDEDVLELATASGTWSKRYDGSSAHAALGAADVDAVFVPEPGAAVLALAATLALAALRGSAASPAAPRCRAR